jgi:hypothetical protein
MRSFSSSSAKRELANFQVYNVKKIVTIFFGGFVLGCRDYRTDDQLAKG